MTKPYVLVVTQLFPTPDDPTRGPWVAEQVDALSELVDIEVVVCTRSGALGVVTRESGVRVMYCDAHALFGSGRLGLISYTSSYRKALRKFLGEMPRRPDIIHSHFGFPDAVVASGEAARLGIPHVVTLHGSDVVRVLPRRDPAGSGMRQAIAGAAAVVCVSRALAALVEQAVPTAVSTSVIPMGFDETVFGLAEDTAAPREGLLFAGRLTAVKNLPVLIRALALARERMPIPVEIVGDGPQREELQGLAADLGVSDLVSFTGSLARSAVAEKMRAAKLVVLPSEREGWGAVVAEALACGTPVVASRVGGVPEILVEPAGGLLVEPSDAKALADALVTAYGREWDARTVAASSLAISSRESALEVAEVYGAVCSGVPAASADDTPETAGGGK